MEDRYEGHCLEKPQIFIWTSQDVFWNQERRNYITLFPKNGAAGQAAPLFLWDPTV